MKWSDVEITDEADGIHSGYNAFEFIKAECKSFAVITTSDDLIQVNAYSPTASTDDKEVRAALFSRLKGKAKSLRFLNGKKFQRETLPLARAVMNVVIVNPARLKVEFIYKRDPRSDSKTYVKDAAVSVAVDFAGNLQLPPAKTQKDAADGVADLGAVAAGKYTLTPDYSKLEDCKFDFEVKPQTVELSAGDNKTVTFEVEPLYQKVQLVAHCLLTIPDRIYIPASDETLEETHATTPDQPPKKVKEGTLKGQWKGKYHGLQRDKDDMNARVELVRRVLKFAHTKAKDDATILKVFMLPECFFQGMYGAYRVEDGSYLLSQLVNLVGGVEWRDWMFVFGTVNLTFGETIREMMNYSPVVRGGLGAATGASGSGGESDDKLRLVQKLVNSAELLDADEMIENLEQIRTPAVNDTVQFQGTQNEEQFGVILSRLFDETSYKLGDDKTDLEFGVTKGLDPEQWKQLKEALKKNVKEFGLTRVVRFIRKCNVKDTPDSLSDWGKYSGYKDITQAHLEPESCVQVTWQGLLLKFIKDGWDRYNVLHPPVSNVPNRPPPLPQPFSAMRWKLATDPGPTRRTEILIDIQTRLNELFQRFDISLPYQKEELESKVAEFLTDDSAALLFGDSKSAAIPENFSASIYPIWKKIFELYIAEKNYKKELSEQILEQLNYRDFCFAAPRKAGGWLTFEEAEKLKPCKKLIFGLEICADHLKGRLSKLVQEPVPEFDSKILEELKLIEETDLNYTKEEREKQNALIAEENRKIRLKNADTRNLINRKSGIETRNKKKANVTIDIQLVPSAGAIPTDTSIVARKGGYCFNCDGWNKKLPGVNYITAWFDGPKVEFVNPVTPHTAIAKGGGPLDIGSFVPERIKLSEKIEATLGEDILSQSGLGELHIYKELELPKN